MYGRKVIHASGRDELLARAKDFAASSIGRNQVKGSNILLGDAHLLPHYLQDRCLWVTDAQNRLHVVLAIRLKLILAVEVDGKGRKAQYRASIDQVSCAILGDNLPGHGQLPVKPGMQ